MTQTLTEVLGANATASGTTITIELSDFKWADGTAMLSSPNTATFHKKLATILTGIWYNTRPSFDSNDLEIVDKTDAVVSQESFSPKTFEIRQGSSQIKYEFNFAIYGTDNTPYDPDKVI